MLESKVRRIPMSVGFFCLFVFLTDKQFTIVPTISLTLKGFLDIKEAFYLIILAHHLVVLNVNASLFSFPSHLCRHFPFQSFLRGHDDCSSILMYCGYTHKDMVSLLRTDFHLFNQWQCQTCSV